MQMTRLKKSILMAMLLSITIPVFAESAPVYDADDMSSPDQMDQAQQYLPPPPPPPQDGAFVPGSAQPNPTGPISTSTMNIEGRVKQLEQQLSQLQSQGSAARVESLQTQVQGLRDQVEQLTRKLDQVQNQQKTMFQDLDARLTQGLKAGKATPPDTSASSIQTDIADNSITSTPTPKPYVASPAKSALTKVAKKAEVPAVAKPAADSKTSDNQPNVAEEQQIYQTAYNLIKQKKYNEAVSALQGMLKKYPSGQFAANAHYWLGELYGLVGKHDQSLSEFDTVISKFPGSPRVSDAQLKMGLIFAAQSKWPDAKAAFKKVINRYPGTGSARLASEQLKQIKIAGH